MEDEIRANAELVVQELRPLSGIDFGYTKESVEWLEGYIERLRNSGEFENVETKTKLTSVFGSFLGECHVAVTVGSGSSMRREHGAWLLRTAKWRFRSPRSQSSLITGWEMV